MENNLSVSVILPVSNYKQKDFKELFLKSISSLRNQQVKPKELVVVFEKNNEFEELLKEQDLSGIQLKSIPWEEEPNFCGQVNFGINNATCEWFSILEFDDEYSAIWFKNVQTYIGHYPEVKGFLPVVVDTDSKNTFAGFTNEATFAANFSMEMSYLTNETLHNYQNFQTSGAVFKKEIIDEFGGFKKSFKLTFVYEFLLRLTYNSVLIMTIPKIGYKHTNMREESLFWDYKFGDKRLQEDEVKFWVQLAKKEYFFNEDRDIKYVSETK